jgi:hypothetical protein
MSECKQAFKKMLNGELHRGAHSLQHLTVILGRSRLLINERDYEKCIRHHMVGACEWQRSVAGLNSETQVQERRTHEEQHLKRKFKSISCILIAENISLMKTKKTKVY